MLRLRSAYRSIITTVLLSVTFVVAANGAQTVTVSDTNGGNKAENWQRQVAPGVRQGQGLRADTLLTAQRQPRIALVIGNSAYHDDPLVNPVNDATDVAQALKDLGFEVNLRKDLNWQGMDEAIENFSKQLRKGGIG
ncbi:MAG: caspase family protein, partial [Moorea sp. SIO3C2]|nr:caspase family protein [Moorena sp. SIO3C2]